MNKQIQASNLDQKTFYKKLFEQGYKLEWVRVPLGLSYFINTPDGYVIVPSPREPAKRLLEDVKHGVEGWIGYQSPSSVFDDIYGSYVQTGMYEQFVDFLNGKRLLPDWMLLEDET